MNGFGGTLSNEPYDALLAFEKLKRAHDRLRTLFDITNALVSKLERDDLFAAVAEQLSKTIRHDYARLTLRNQSGGLDVFALHCTRPQFLEMLQGPLEPAGMPADEVLATGKVAVVRDVDLDLYPNPRFRRY